MTRTDSYLDGVLRHLGAAYYDSLQGRASEADVTRAVESVTEHLAEDALTRVDGETGGLRMSRERGWSRRVSDVMATSLVTVDRAASYKEVARLLAEHRISGMPVLKNGSEVAGVISEADLLAAQAGRRRRSLFGRRRREYTAGALMTAPAVTIGPHMTVHAASRLMSSRHIRLLPVVDKRGQLIGVVSRRDLLSVFLRADEEISADVRKVLDEILLAGPGEAEVAVRDGVVTLTGALDPTTGTHGDLIPVAIKLMWDVDGVVNVIDRLGEQRPSPDGDSAPPSSRG
jgi:CBS domain-containing protein